MTTATSGGTGWRPSLKPVHPAIALAVANRGRMRIRVKLITSPSGQISDACPGRLAFSDAPDAPATPLKTHRSLDASGGPFSGRPGRPLARAAEHMGLDRLAALHQAIDPTCFFGQPVPYDRVLHVSSTYPTLAGSTISACQKPVC